MSILKLFLRKFLSSFILMLFIPNINAQQPFNFVGSPSTQQSSNVLNQVDQFTGKIGLSIPLYTYVSSSSNLKFNVSVDYSSGGLNLNQDPGCVGAGWNLNAGGIIHREINGKPDDIIKKTPGQYDVSGFIYSEPIPNSICGFKYRSVGYYPNPDDKIAQDTEPDEFHFNFMGKSGSFNIPKGGTIVNGPKVITKPLSNLDFSFTLGNRQYPIVSLITDIQILDNDGILYTFSALQTTGRMSPKSSQISTSPPTSFGYSYYTNSYTRIWEDYVTDWLLTKIEDKNTGEEINLTYETYYSKAKFPTSILSYTNQTNFSYKEYMDNNNSEYWGIAQRLKSVSVSNGDNLIFNYDINDRCDLFNNKALLNLNIINKSNKIMYGFDYSYFKDNNEINYSGCSSLNDAERLTKWLFLNTVKKSTSTSSSIIASFEYIKSSDKIVGQPDNILPKRKSIFLGERNTYAYGGHYKIQDAFGFYNGGQTPSGTTGYCNMVDPSLKMVNFCDAPRIGYPEIGSLKRVNYPTGGSTNIEYEGNNILKNNGDEELSFGIRVKKIIQKDGVSNENDIVKEYKYLREDGKTSGFAMDLPPHSYTNEERQASGGNNVYQTLVASSSSVVAPVLINGSPVIYERVEEVTSSGKIISEFSNPPSIYGTLSFLYPYSNKQRVAEWKYGLLTKQTVVNQTGNIVKLTENNYQVDSYFLTNPEYKSMKTAYKRETSAINFGASYDPAQCAINDLYWKFTYDIYYPLTGKTELVSATEKNYLKNGSVLENKVEFEYDPLNYNLKKTTSYNSSNEKLEKILFYPSDYSTTSNSFKLVQKGITSLPVSSISLLTKPNGDKFISGFEKTEFQQLPNFTIRPLSVSTLKTKNLIQILSNKVLFTPEENYGEATTKTSTDFLYDQFNSKGNLIQSTSKQTKQSAIWDQEYNVIVAKANATFNDIAYSSFESTENGNWEYSTSGFFDITAPTGRKVFDLTNQNIVKNNLQSAQTYIISYWSNNGPVSINSNSNPVVIGNSFNGWTFFKHKITGVTNVQISGAPLIDELRLCPQNSRMTSTTYEPLVGLTSESGVDGQITKYTYDSFGRLINTQDEFGNISKVYCYNFQGLPSSCGDAYTFRNFATTFSLNNNNCPPGSTTTPYQYNVPEGRYISFTSQSDADNQAANDALTYGQAIADRNTNSCQQTTIYARLTYENVYYSAAEVTGDVVVKYYSDPNGTIPVYVNNLPVDGLETWFEGSYFEYYFTFVGTAYQSVIAQGARLEWQETQCDYGYYPCYTQTYNRNFTLNPSTYYQIIY